jgi:hypothetical protein
MLDSAAPPGNLSPLLMIEGGGTMIAFAAAFAWPRLGARWFARIERVFARLARRRNLSVAVVGAATLLLRLAMLPFCPIPLPFLPDDFSLLLAADTFAHGRLTNPTPAMWTHFESIHITMQPTYMSMYFPAQGLLLAAGKVLFGQPWFAVLLTSAFMAAALCWALLGGILAILRLGLFSYWVNTYTGGGLLLALAGALVLGALPRLMKTARFRYGLLMAVGIVLLALSRPYEGLLLCLPVAVVLGRWACRGANRPAPSVLLGRAAVPLALIVAALAWLGYYDYRAFGSPLTLPYTVNRAAYAIAPYYVWQAPHPEPAYRHPEMRRFYYESEMTVYTKEHNLVRFLPIALVKIWTATVFFAGFALLPPLIMMRRVLHDRRIRFLVLCVLVLMAGMVIEIYMIPHYLAPFTAAFYAIGLQCMRHLRVWKPEGRPAGVALVRLTVLLCFLLAGLRVFAAPLHFSIPEWPASNWSGMWYGPERYGTDRARIEDQLERLPGKQLVLVRPSRKRNVLDQWVYNQADIGAAKVAWAAEMDAANNRELLNCYSDRKPWLVQMDTEPATLTPYPAPAPSPRSEAPARLGQP